MIYVIEAGGRYKIGKTSNVKRRMGEIQTSCPHDVELVRQWPGEDESSLHIAMQGKHVRGEWYDLDADDIAELDRIMQPDPRDEPPIAKIGRVRVKGLGCTFCGRDVYYYGDPKLVRCEYCDHDMNPQKGHRTRTRRFAAVLKQFGDLACLRDT